MERSDEEVRRGEKWRIFHMSTEAVVFIKISSEGEEGGCLSWGGGGFYPLYGGERSESLIKADRAPRTGTRVTMSVYGIQGK